MTRIDKLYASVLANPGQMLAFRDFIALIEAFGFRHARTKGSHQSYVHSNCPRLLHPAAGQAREAVSGPRIP